MEARNRFVKDWIAMIRNGQIALPRFQRFEAWYGNLVESMLTSIVNQLPIGSFLVMGVTGDPPFSCRPIMGAPNLGRITELLLDGQQRLTALWRSLNDNYPYETYLVRVPEDTLREDVDVGKVEFIVERQPRWFIEGRRYPLWIDNPKECWARKFIPVRLLNPDLPETEVFKWIKEALPDSVDTLKLYGIISNLRSRIANYVIPYLFLEPTTPKDVAIDVFIKLNTSYVKLTPYDIVVAQMEEVVGASLHEMMDDLRRSCPYIRYYVDEVSEIILPVAALLQDKTPTHSNFMKLDLKKLRDDWNKIKAGVSKTVDFLIEECVYGMQVLPTRSVLAPLIALWSEVPEDKPKDIGNVRILLRKYLWRAFFTDRYDRSVNTAMHQDYVAMRKILFEGEKGTEVPCLNENLYPLPNENLIMNAKWPTYRDRLARATLLLSLRGGAEDLADGSKINLDNITKREYHHVYPVAWFDSTQKDISIAYKALNCILITWRTNRSISAKTPLQYLLELSEASSLGEQEVRRRLKSHFIDYDLLVKEDYDEFIQKRAEKSVKAIRALCNGEKWYP